LIPVSTASAPVFLLISDKEQINLHWQNHIVTEIFSYIFGILAVHIIVEGSGAQGELTGLINECGDNLWMTVSLI
jgi:hypothetical protein